MKRICVVLLLMFSVLGCNDSGSSDSISIPKPKPIKGSLDFVENSSPFNVRIFNDNIPLDQRASTSLYGITNYTLKNYNNISFAIDPENIEKYSISAYPVIGNTPCTTLAYGDSCFIYVRINTKTADPINIKIKMMSDQGEVTFNPKTIDAKYRIQPTETTLNFTAAEQTKTFVVYLSSPYRTVLNGGGILYSTVTGDNARVDYAFKDGSLQSANFAISTTDETRKRIIDGKSYNVQNCFSSPTKPLLVNSDVNYCYVDVTFKGSVTATPAPTETLTIKAANTEANKTWKPATVTLSATN